jgi:hypothetical protein
VKPAPDDPVAQLATRVHDALDDLHRLRCNDPAANAAVHAVKLTEQTLECWWLPTLDRICET